MRKTTSKRDGSAEKRVWRRDALKGLGVLAISGPAFSAIGCSKEKMQDAGGAGVSASESAGANAGGSAGASTSGGTSASGSAGAAPSTNMTGTTTTTMTTPMNGSGGGTSAAGGAQASGASGHAAAGASTAGANSAGATASDPARPPFADAASCTLTATDIEGPFYIDDGEVPNDESLVRSDVRESLPGVETRFYFRLLDAKNKCAPIAGAQIYIWHCNADGYYSGFDGQDPSKPYMGSANPSPMNLDRFCRGVQVTDADGVVGFVTVYPGWYAGRPIHVHLTAQLPGAPMRMITTQLYFEAAFTKDVHTTEPAYMARAASIPAGSLNPPVGKPMPTMKHTPGLVTGTLNVIVNRG